jgi:hypothetical protein
MMFNRSTALLLLVVSGSSVDAFTPSKLASIRSTVSTLRSTTLEPKVNNAPELTTWECDDDIQCVEVPACDEEGCRTSLDVRIHGEWYDLTG